MMGGFWQSHPFGKRQRAPVCMPQTIVGMNEEADRGRMAALGLDRPTLERKRRLREGEQGAGAKSRSHSVEAIKRPVVEGVQLGIALPAKPGPHTGAGIADKHQGRRRDSRCDLGYFVAALRMKYATGCEFSPFDRCQDVLDNHWNRH